MSALQNQTGGDESVHAPRGGQTMMEETNDSIDLKSAAMEYRSVLGWSVIPLGKQAKEPALGTWKQYQTEKPGFEAVEQYWSVNPQCNIGVTTGTLSNLLVLDMDGKEALESLGDYRVPVTPTAITPRGRHYYFSMPQGEPGNRVGLLPGVDVRAEGGYVVAPPSVHPSGDSYIWAEGLAPFDVEVADCPDWLLALLQTEASSTSKTTALEWRELAAKGVTEGERNLSVARFTGHLLSKGVDAIVVYELITAWNEARCHPPLDEEEISRTIDSICGAELRKQKGESR